VLLELAHVHPLPAPTDLPQGREDQLPGAVSQDRQAALLNPEPRERLGSPILLHKGSFQQVGRANAIVMDSRAPQVTLTSCKTPLGCQPVAPVYIAACAVQVAMVTYWIDSDHDHQDQEALHLVRRAR